MANDTEATREALVNDLLINFPLTRIWACDLCERAGWDRDTVWDLAHFVVSGWGEEEALAIVREIKAKEANDGRDL